MQFFAKAVNATTGASSSRKGSPAISSTLHTSSIICVIFATLTHSSLCFLFCYGLLVETLVDR